MANIKLLKSQYVRFYEDVPVQKYAAMHIGRDEDTIIRWRKNDVMFADAVKKAETAFIRKKMLTVKAEFALERLFKSVFSEKQEIEVKDKRKPRDLNPANTVELRRAYVKLIKEQVKSSPRDHYKFLTN